jgi:hypothetical protein
MAALLWIEPVPIFLSNDSFSPSKTFFSRSNWPNAFRSCCCSRTLAWSGKRRSGKKRTTKKKGKKKEKEEENYNLDKRWPEGPSAHLADEVEPAHGLTLSPLVVSKRFSLDFFQFIS